MVLISRVTSLSATAFGTGGSLDLHHKMTDQHQQLLPTRFNDTVSPHSPLGTTLTLTHGPRKCTSIGMVHSNATINILPDSIFLEIFACHLRAHREPFTFNSLQMGEWQRLTHVCQRWRQIVYTSPRYLDLFLYCSNRTSVAKNLSSWPAFPIAMDYQLRRGKDDDEVITLLKHSDRVRFVRIKCLRQEWEKLVTAMQEPFPVLTDLDLLVGAESWDHVPALLSGFLGGSAPCLQRLTLDCIPFPALPTLLSAPSHDLVSLQLGHIPPSGYISPEAMVASLAMLTKLEILTLHFLMLTPTLPFEKRRRRPDPPMRSLLPALIDFDFNGRSEYLEDFVAQIDAPRVITGRFKMELGPLDFVLPVVPQLFLFIGRIEHLRFRRVVLALRNGSQVDVQVRVNTHQHGVGDRGSELVFGLASPSEWSSTHVMHVLTQIFALCPNVDYLHIIHFDDPPGRHDYFDRTEWLAVFRLFPTVKTLHVYGSLAKQYARALDDVPAEMVTDILPCLHSLILGGPGGLESATQFVSLRQLYGRPITLSEAERVY